MNPSGGRPPRIAPIASLALFHAGILLMLFSDTHGFLEATILCIAAAATIASLYNVRFPRTVPISLGLSVIIAVNHPVSIPISLAILATLWLVVGGLHLLTRRQRRVPGSLPPSNSDW